MKVTWQDVRSENIQVGTTQTKMLMDGKVKKENDVF